VRFLQPKGCQSKNGGVLRREYAIWFPAFAGMTRLKIARRARVALYPPNVRPKKRQHPFRLALQTISPSTSFLSRTAVRLRGNDEFKNNALGYSCALSTDCNSKKTATPVPPYPANHLSIYFLFIPDSSGLSPE
jgi:hypothetical protein